LPTFAFRCKNNYLLAKSDFDPLDSIVFLTNRVGRLLIGHMRKDCNFASIGLSMPQMAILVDLWARDGVTQQELAISLIKDKGTIARALESMEELGLVTRQTDEEDKRNKRIFLTEKGRQMQDATLPLARKVTKEASSGISDEELRICKEVLGKIYKNLNPITE
jgi:DNA-binding MarR family transcriptional regulator